MLLRLSDMLLMLNNENRQSRQRRHRATSPNAKLEIHPGTVTAAGAFASSALNIYNPTSIGSLSQISFGISGYGTGINSAAYMSYISTDATGAGFGDLIFGTRNVNTDTAPTERVRITSAGNVGIGTTSPGAKLDVKGKIKISQTALGDGIEASTPIYVTFTTTAWIDVYQMAENEKGLFLAAGGGGYGPSAVIHIHRNYAAAPTVGYLNVMSIGGDTSGYSFLFQLTSGGMVQVQCNLANGTQMSFTKIGGFNAN